MYKLWITFGAVDNLWIRENPTTTRVIGFLSTRLGWSPASPPCVSTQLSDQYPLNRVSHLTYSYATHSINYRMQAPTVYIQWSTPRLYLPLGSIWFAVQDAPSSGSSLSVQSLQYSGATGRNRTGTPLQREILSLLCLPISPQSQNFGALSVSRTQHQRIMSPLL